MRDRMRLVTESRYFGSHYDFSASLQTPEKVMWNSATLVSEPRLRLPSPILSQAAARAIIAFTFSK